MTRIAVVYHSEKGRTEIIANEIASGVNSVDGVLVDLISVTDDIDWDILKNADGIIFGSPTYMGSVSAQFKKFMDESGAIWLSHQWKNKVAAGFANSHGYSGDKLNVLIQLAVFAAQHGMVWVGSGDMQAGSAPEDVNRVGSFLGVMSQSDTSVSPDMPPSGDRKTAFNLGVRVAEFAAKLK